MVDHEVPTNQFHPYQPVDAIPQTEKPATGLAAMLNKVGISEEATNSITGSLNQVDVKGTINKARDYARANPSKVLGGLAALIIGAGLMRSRGKSTRNRTI
jgi:hypothetical protein